MAMKDTGVVDLEPWLTTNKWAFAITTDCITCEEAARELAGFEAVTVLGLGGLTTAAWDEIDDHRDIHRLGRLAVHQINCALALLEASPKRIEWTGRVWRRDITMPTGVWTSLVFTPGHGEAILSIPPLRGMSPPLGDQLSNLSAASLPFGDAIAIFESCGRDVRAIWCAYEALRRAVGGEHALRRKGWSTPSDHKHFTATVQHIRHYKPRETPPEAPLTPLQCREYVRNLIIRYVDEQLSRASRG